jgi:antitoxin component of MazEF toxin-antitoxin module
MLMQKVRKSGNSYVVTIPKDEMERQDLHEGDVVALEVRKVEYRVQMDPDVRAAFERSVKMRKEDYDYLATN